MNNPLTVKNPQADRKAAIEAAKAKVKSSNPAAEEAVIMKYVKPSETKDRTRVVFDDSGSMTSQIDNAKEGVIEYMRNCVPNTTAVSVHFLCTNNEESSQLEKLNTDLPQTGLVLKHIHLNLGGTPLFTTMNKVVDMELTTRMVAFTDGSPTDDILSETNVMGWGHERHLKNADIIIAKAKAKGIPIDTVFFGSGSYADAIALLKYFAEQTGGYFLHFDPAKVNFRTAFKYLAPVNRKMLASASFRAELESGKRN